MGYSPLFSLSLAPGLILAMKSSCACTTYASGTRKPSARELMRCLRDMLTLPEQGPTYVIVDALYECPNSTEMPSPREKVLGLIEELVDLRLPNLHICVSSRPEIDIRNVLEPLTTLHVSLHDETGQKEDIAEYINLAVRSDRKMQRWREKDQRLVIDTLAQKADGMYVLSRGVSK